MPTTPAGRADLAAHPFFEPFTDPESGMRSFILKERVAPLQQSFYFTNSSLSPDEKWLWMYVAFPPAVYKTLAVVSLDPTAPLIRHFPHAEFDGSSPMVAPEGNGIYFTLGPNVWRMDLEGRMQTVCTLSPDYIAGRKLHRLATHLTMSADRRYFLLDGHIGNHWLVGLGDIATGQVQIVKEFAHCHNHAQFSPIDPELFLIAEDWFHDAITGRRFHYNNRIWLMDIHDTRFEGLTPDVYCKHMTGISHEWWGSNGMICYVDYERGAYELDLKTRRATLVWPGPLCHAHCTADRRLWCADESPYKWDKTPCQVRLFDRASGQVRNIFSAMPQPPASRGQYHLDPHPQFSPAGTWVVSTTTVRGQVDVALTPVNQ